ncbi:transcriptional regulator family: Fungal Specific TF and C2H2 zinc finger [Trichoderma harzianum]|nr:transcriptional regulator family: Fungal Specific TF and C2H2 zinc finger [Trichoderma harzianum]
MPDTTEIGIYQCGFCKAEYKRADHLVRHVRSHTKQRPFLCLVCGKGFSRQDLLKRHATIHHTQVLAGGEPSRSARNGPRVHQACRSCAAKKLKCTDEKPCKRCRERGMSCEEQSEETSGTLPPGQPALSDPITPTSAMEFSLQTDILIPSGTDDTTITETLLASNSQKLADIIQDVLGVPDVGHFRQDDSAFPPFDNTDFSFLDVLDMPDKVPSTISPSSIPSAPESNIGVGSEAFQKSSVISGWDPHGEVDIRSPHEDLVLPNNSIRPEDLSSPSTVSGLETTIMSLATRDQIMHMILRRAPKNLASCIIETFPTPEILTSIILYALARMRETMASSFIHEPSFDINNERLELLGALIAYGSVCSPSLALRHFGYAVQDILPRVINDLVEEDDTARRDLGVAQAFYIQLYLAYWSAICRKIEVAETSTLLGATSLRRGHHFRKESYEAPETYLCMSELSLDQQWACWIAKESMKRLAYFAMTLDASMTLARKMPPVFSYAEMSIPLPASMDLWAATTCQEWQKILLQRDNLRLTQPPPLSRILRHPYAVGEHFDMVDTQFTIHIFLSGFWALVLEYQQLSSLSKDAGMHDFVLNSRHSELVSTLEQFKAEVKARSILCPQMEILRELFCLHLHVSFDKVASYAGRGSEEDTRSAVPYVQRWFDNPKARDSLWHAGQVFNAAKKHAKKHLADMGVVALYHAAVVLWVWALLRKTQQPHDEVALPQVAIDGDDNLALFKLHNGWRGQLVLTERAGQLIPLTEPALVTDLARDIILSNWGHEPVPITTQEVLCIMDRFSDITRKRFSHI